MELSKQIIARRKELKMNQQDLASASGLSVATIKRIETGKWINLKQLSAICDALGLEISLQIKK